MFFLNEAEIDMYLERHERHPVLRKATKLLSEFRHLVNNNSDGWAYWGPPVRAAKKLMQLISNRAEVTEADLKKAITPIKSFCTRHKFQFPQDALK